MLSRHLNLSALQYLGGVSEWTNDCPKILNRVCAYLEIEVLGFTKLGQELTLV